jgi:DisA bacterial checkpoint controller nucleotide-binding
VRHAYPEDLAQVLRTQWDNPRGPAARAETTDGRAPARLPDAPMLEDLLSMCYQISLLREEERPLRFRLILCEPARFAPELGPPTGFHRGVRLEQGSEGRIWGLVHSGPRWLQVVHGGRETYQPLPAVLVVRVTGPGRLAVCQGLVTLATLHGGQIHGPLVDVFDSQWLPESFATVRAELWPLHTAARAQAHTPWALLEPSFPLILGQQVIRRIISLMRTLHHGGTLIFLPPELASSVLSDNPYMTIKYPLLDEEPRKRVRTLIVSIMNALAAAYGQRVEVGRAVGWEEYMASNDVTLARLDEALFEVAHLIASLSGVDGAIVLTKRFEILGFGAEILGNHDHVLTVAKALDAEGEYTELERSEDVGTRHRSAYRLCQALPGADVIVVSQDGTVRLVKWRKGMVTYWEQVATSVLDM